MSFASDLQKFAKKTGLNMDQVVRGTVLGLGRSVVEKSPVKEGRFRGNWNHNTGAPIGRIFDTYDKDGAPTVARIQMSLASIKAGNIEYLTNHLPYGPGLESGNSTQAPNGMVRITEAEFRDSLAKAVRGIR